MMNDRAGKMDPSPLSMLSAQSLPIKDLQSQSASISVQFPGMTRQQFAVIWLQGHLRKLGFILCHKGSKYWTLNMVFAVALWI